MVENSFENMAREWFTKNKHIWTEGHSKTIISPLELNAFPWLGAQPVSSITAPALLVVLRRIKVIQGGIFKPALLCRDYRFC